MSWLAVFFVIAQPSSVMAGRDHAAFEKNQLVASSKQTPQGFSCVNVDQIPQSECEALVDLYSKTNGPNWANRSGWLTSNTPCNDWFGVSNCSYGHVVVLDLRNNGLSGSLPASIANLSELVALNLSLNQLVGSIPATLGTITSLQILELGWNQLSGEIPPQLGDLSSLKKLRLSVNPLTGSIPPAFGALSNLEFLYLEENQLGGNIPRELGELGRLRTLSLGNNQLTGSIPPELGNLSNLRYLLLSGNRLSGSVPAEIGSLSGLEILTLSSNLLHGALPLTLMGLTHLDYLDYEVTNLCEPGNTEFKMWLGMIRILGRTGMTCGSGSVQGMIWNDRNGNGLIEPGEPGIPGLQVTLSSSIILQVQPDGARVTVTDDGGGFAFDRVADGGYQLIVVDPLGSWPTVTQDVTVIDGSPTVIPPIGFSPPLVKIYIPFAVNYRLLRSPFNGRAE
jgi:hypothetical protein